MDSTNYRCRHHSIDWIDSHTCRCDQCGKFGHWIENPELVMWHGSKKSRPIQRVVSQPSIQVANSIQFAPKAG